MLTLASWAGSISTVGDVEPGERPAARARRRRGRLERRRVRSCGRRRAAGPSAAPRRRGTRRRAPRAASAVTRGVSTGSTTADVVAPRRAGRRRRRRSARGCRCRRRAPGTGASSPSAAFPTAIRSSQNGERLPGDLGERPPSSRASAFGEPNRCSRRRRAGRRSALDPPRLRVDVQRPPRTKPQSVIPRSAASSTARLEGAPTATRIGQPATAAFCTSSNERRPLTQRSASASGRRPFAERPADDLVEGVVAADVLAQAEQLAARRRRGRSRAARRWRRTPAAPRGAGRAGSRRARRARSACSRRAARRPRPPRARPCRRRRRTKRCRSCAAAAPGRSPARPPRRRSPRGRPARRAAARAGAPRRGRSRARAPRRARACASSPRPARRRSGSRAAPRRRAGPARSSPPGSRTTSTGAVLYGGASLVERAERHRAKPSPREPHGRRGGLPPGAEPSEPYRPLGARALCDIALEDVRDGRGRAAAGAAHSPDSAC